MWSAALYAAAACAMGPPVKYLSAAFAPRSAHAVLAELAGFAASESDAMPDAYGTGQFLQSFEAEVAATLGKERGRFMPTGVCAQMAALAVYAELPARRSAIEPRPSFICHATSHVLLWEEDSARQLLGLVPLIAGTDRPMSAADVEYVLKRQAAVGVIPAAIIVRPYPPQQTPP